MHPNIQVFVNCQKSIFPSNTAPLKVIYPNIFEELKMDCYGSELGADLCATEHHV